MFPFDLFRTPPTRYSGGFDRYFANIPAGSLRDTVIINEPCYRCGNPAPPAPTANGKPVCRKCVRGGNRKRGRHARR